MTNFHVHVFIENKSGINDPEGETILHNLVLKSGYSSISKIRSGKILKFEINEKNKTTAKNVVQKLCDELRIYNPVVSRLTIEVHEA